MLPRSSALFDVFKRVRKDLVSLWKVGERMTRTMPEVMHEICPTTITNEALA